MLEISRVVDHQHGKLISPSWKIAFGYLVALAIAETLNTLFAPQAGVILHGLVLLALLLHASLSIRKREHRFLIILALVPLIRLLNLTLPLNYFPPVYWYAVVGAPLSIAAFMGARFSGLKGNMIGLRLSWRTIPIELLIGVLGLGIGFIEYLILRPEPLVAELRWDLIWLPILILLVFTGLLEEVIFRGMLQSTAIRHLGQLGVLYVAVLFAVLHFGYRSPLNLLFVFGVALLFGLIVQRRGTLLGVSISHGLTNISLYLVFPFLFASSAGATSPPVELLLPIVATPTPFQNIPPTPRTSSTPVVSYTSPNILGAAIQDGVSHNSAKLIPSQPTVHPTQCGSPPGWVDYIVQSGDTLWAISIRTDESVETLLLANCLENADLIFTGQRLYVPHLPLDTAPTSTTTSPPPPNIPTLSPTQT
ncbi:MAG: CPBP family glutamic-type intramembrane protease, partial [Anaerolineales bacterium]